MIEQIVFSTRTLPSESTTGRDSLIPRLFSATSHAIRGGFRSLSPVAKLR